MPPRWNPNSQVYIWLADYYVAHQQYDLAAEMMTRLIAVDNSYYYYGNRSEIYLVLGDYARARDDARQAITQRPDAAYGYAQLAHVSRSSAILRPRSIRLTRR